MASHMAVSGPLKGMFDGFEGYRTVSDADIQNALQKGLVVVDTNVLLNLYRYDDAARDDLFTVLGAVGDRLFIPHQVMVEFWRNRESAARERAGTAQVTIDQLEATHAQAQGHLRTWANRLAIADELRDQLLEALANTFSDLCAAVGASAGGDGNVGAKNTEEDAVLAKLNDLLAQKVGEALPREDHVNAVKEGLRRVEKQIPPGYKDRKKDGDDVAGDYLVWHQSLIEAKRRCHDVGSLVFVTGDSSDEDWYRKESNEIRGPRTELFEEARTFAEVRLFMLRPPSLVFHAQSALNLSIDEGTVEKIARSDTTSRLPGWTTENVSRLLERLTTEGSVQAAVIRMAIANGGFVSRDQVYEIGSYGPDRTLRGFTRPPRRVMQSLQDEGVLADGVDEPMETVYDPKQSYVVAAGFRVPREFLAIEGDPKNDQEVEAEPSPQHDVRT